MLRVVPCALLLAVAACAHPMHVDAEPGAEVWVDERFVGTAPVDVDVSSLTSIGIFNVYLSDVRNDSSTPSNMQLCAGLVQWACMPFLCAAAAGFTAGAIAAPIAVAGEEPPASVRVDVERGRVDY